MGACVTGAATFVAGTLSTGTLLIVLSGTDAADGAGDVIEEWVA